ncbi:hypothetical protein AB0919_37690 [Streptomyces sp. NPDC046994]|uniref:hypothetical protein n=1 Tax=unclassified Streptomyces TaxID=2593676 RepID=UPI0034014E93
MSLARRLPCVLLPVGTHLALAIFGSSGALWAAQVTLPVSFLAELPPDQERAQGMGMAASMNVTVSAIGGALVGGVARMTSAASAITLAGVASVAFALWPCVLWVRRGSGASHRDAMPRETEAASR